MTVPVVAPVVVVVAYWTRDFGFASLVRLCGPEAKPNWHSASAGVKLGNGLVSGAPTGVAAPRRWTPAPVDVQFPAEAKALAGIVADPERVLTDWGDNTLRTNRRRPRASIVCRAVASDVLSDSEAKWNELLW